MTTNFICLLTGAQVAIPPETTHSHAEWLRQYAMDFVPAFLASGMLYGAIYVLIMRAIRVDRKKVEDWFEGQRKRFSSGPVPVIETIHPVMLSALYAIYGRTVARRFLTSFSIGLLFSGVILVVLHHEYRQVPIGIRETKRILERQADPFLYKYATTPELASDFKKAFETIDVSYPQGDVVKPVYEGGVYEQIREASNSYDSRFLTVVSTHHDRILITLLCLFEGTSVSPGFSWLDVTILFAFNVLLDFVSITVMIESLRWLKRDLSVIRAIPSFLFAAIGTLVCCFISFLSYSMFFRGNTSFFYQFLIGLPFSLLALTVAFCIICGIVYVVLRKFEGALLVVFFGGLAAFVLGSMGISGTRAIWGEWRSGWTTRVAWKDLFHPPYVLALTTIVPASLAFLAFSLMLTAKLTAEPTRVVPEAYMTFIREEVGGTQASGIIVVLGIITAAIVAGLLEAAK